MDELTRAEILGALARGYCHEGNTHKEMDQALLNSQADEIMALRSLSPFQRGEVVVPRSVVDDIGMWLSAALEDKNICEKMKSDIRKWFDATERV